MYDFASPLRNWPVLVQCVAQMRFNLLGIGVYVQSSDDEQIEQHFGGAHAFEVLKGDEELLHDIGFECGQSVEGCLNG